MALGKFRPWSSVVLLAGLLVAPHPSEADERSSGRPPNVVLFFVDNLGNGDLGCCGSQLHRTPHIDRLAREGTRFTSFYVASGVCTPSRASLLTGCYPRRINLHVSGSNVAVLRPVDTKGLSPDETTLAEVLKQAGYATAAFGKWHLGDQPPFLPTHQGFDTFFGIPYSDDMTKDKQPDAWPELPLLQDDRVIEAPVDRDYLVQRCTTAAIAFMERNRRAHFSCICRRSRRARLLVRSPAQPFAAKAKTAPTATRWKSWTGRPAKFWRLSRVWIWNSGQSLSGLPTTGP